MNKTLCVEWLRVIILSLASRRFVKNFKCILWRVFSRSLARKAGENQATACGQDPLSSNSMCTDIEFEQIVYKSPYGIAWCIEN